MAALDASSLYTGAQRESAKRIMKALISSRSIAKAGNDDAESRVDYLADTLGLEKAAVVDAVNLMREQGLLADSMDMSAYIRSVDSQNKSAQILERFAKLERFILERIPDEGCSFNLKELNERALDAGIAFSTVKNIRTALYYWAIKGYTKKGEYNSDKKMDLVPAMKVSMLNDMYERRLDICRFLVEELYDKSATDANRKIEDVPVQFSLLGLYKAYCECPRLHSPATKIKTADIEDSLLYLSKIGALSLEGGFLVLYNGMEIKRLITDNKIRYKLDD